MARSAEYYLDIRPYPGFRHIATLWYGGGEPIASGIGTTPQEALLRAAQQWAGKTDRP